MIVLCLPHFVRRDFFDVLAELRQSGYNFEEKWFASHLEFRFPKIGSIAAEGVELELRQALEPWNVLAEETYFRWNRSQRGLIARPDTGEGVGVHDGIPLRDCMQWAKGASSISRASPERRWRAYGIARDGFLRRCTPRSPFTRPLSSTSSTAGRSVRLADVPTTLDHPTAILTLPVQLTLRRRKNGAWSAFKCPVTALGPMAVPEQESNPIFPLTLDLRMPAPGQKTQTEKPGLVP